MCIEIAVINAGTRVNCETVGQLAQELGIPPINVSPDPEDFCLCNAKLDDLGARKATFAEGFPFPQYIIEQTGKD